MRVRIKPLELLVAVSIIVTLVVIALPPDFFDRFDRNPDNTFPIAGVVPVRLVPSASNDSPQFVVISRQFDGSGDERIELALLNTGSSDLYYYGYTPMSFAPRMPEGKVHPLYKEEVNNGDHWEDGSPGWCGTGAADMRLKSGHAGRFTVFRSRDQPAIRVGVYCSSSQRVRFTESSIVWSPVIEGEPRETP